MYKFPDSERWKGILSLTYLRRISDKGWLARKRGHIIEGAYDIEIWRENAEFFKGTSTMIYRNPDTKFRNSAEWTNIKLGDGKLFIDVRNTNNLGTAEAVFHQRKRWREVDAL